MCRNNVQLLQLATPLTMTNTGVCDFRDHTLVERKIRMKRWLWWILWLLLIVDLSIWIHQVPQRKELFYLSKHGRPVTMKSEALQCEELKWEISSSTVLLLCVCVCLWQLNPAAWTLHFHLTPSSDLLFLRMISDLNLLPIIPSGSPTVRLQVSG